MCFAEIPLKPPVPGYDQGSLSLSGAPVGPLLSWSHNWDCVRVGVPVCGAGIYTAALSQAESPAAGIPPPSTPPVQGLVL